MKPIFNYFFVILAFFGIGLAVKRVWDIESSKNMNFPMSSITDRTKDEGYKPVIIRCNSNTKFYEYSSDFTNEKVWHTMEYAPCDPKQFKAAIAAFNQP